MPNFISKVTLSNAGSTVVNGLYTRNSGGTTTFNKSGGESIAWIQIENIWANYNSNGDPLYISYDLINWEVNEGLEDPPTAITENSLTFLFDPIFYKSEIQNEIYKIKLEGCSLSYVNGIYSQTVDPSLINNRPYFTKDDDPDMHVYYDSTEQYWVIEDEGTRNYNNPLFYKNYTGGQSWYPRVQELNWAVADGGEALNNGQTSPTITAYEVYNNDDRADLDPVYMQELRDYQIAEAIPTFPNINIRQHIHGASFNSKKAEFSGNVFKYIKYDNNNDVPHLKSYGKQIYGTNSNARSGLVGKNLQENRFPFYF